MLNTVDITHRVHSAASRWVYRQRQTGHHYYREIALTTSTWVISCTIMPAATSKTLHQQALMHQDRKGLLLPSLLLASLLQKKKRCNTEKSLSRDGLSFSLLSSPLLRRCLVHRWLCGTRQERLDLQPTIEHGC